MPDDIYIDDDGMLVVNEVELDLSMEEMTSLFQVLADHLDYELLEGNIGLNTYLDSVTEEAHLEQVLENVGGRHRIAVRGLRNNHT